MVCVTVNLMDMRRLRKEMYTFLVEDSLCRLLLFICYELAQRAAAIFASNTSFILMKEISRAGNAQWTKESLRELISNIGKISFKGLSMPVSTCLKNCFH